MKEEDYNMEDDGDSNVKIEFSSSEIKEEIKLTNQFGLLSCQECGKVMHTQKNLEEHLAFVHQGIVKYKCSYCQKGFERSNYLREHIKHTHLEKKFQCDVCDFKTSIKKRFETHKQTHTGEEVKKVPSEFKCPECEKLLPSQKFLEEHIAFVHQGIVKYKCSECDKGFERSHYLREHIKHSHLEKRFQCQTCDFKTSIKRRFETHVLSHTLPGDIKEKPKKTYQCDFCGYTSIKKQNFESHVRTHTGEKPYACDQCPLKFADKGYFKTHLKIHSGEIKVACEECGKMVNKNKMKYHIQSKHSGVSSKRSYEYPEEVKQMAVKLAAEIGVYKAAKTLNLKIHAVRKWKQGITEYQGTVQSEEDKLRCPTCLLILPSRYLLHRHRETVHFEKVEKRKIIKYPEHMRREIAQFALQYGQSAAREKYEVNESTLREWITFFHQPILCTECGLPFSYLRKLQNHMQTVHNMNFEPENQEMNLEVLKQRAEQAIELKQKAKEEAKLKQQKKMEIQQQLYQQHLMQQEMMKSMQLLKESNEEKCKNEGEGETESEQMEIKPEINVKEEVDYNEDEEEDFVEGYDDSFRNDDYDDSFRDDDYDNEEMKEKIEPWLVQMSALTILTITSLHQLHFGKFYRNRFLRKLFFKQEIELQPKTLKFVTTKPKKKKRTPNVKAGSLK